MTQPRTNGLLYSADADLARAVSVFVGDRGKLRVIDTARKLRNALSTRRDALVIVDLRCEDATDILADLASSDRHHPVIAIGVPGSKPFLEAHRIGVYAAEPLPLDRWSLQARLKGAFELLRLTLENETLREEARGSDHAARAAAETERPPQPGVASLGHWGRTLRQLDDVDALMDGIVQGVAETMLLSRVGLFARAGGDEEYVYRAGVRCLASSPTLRYPVDDPLVEWLEERACQVARQHLEHVPDTHLRSILRDELDELGAEIIVPLQGRGQLIGWLFVGQHGTGQPLTRRDQEDLLVVADTASTALEKALLYEETTLQKTMVENLLQGMPSGIVAVDTLGVVQSYNRAASTIFALPPDDVVGHPVAVLDGHLADLLLRALETDPPDLPIEWKLPASQKYLLGEARRLTDAGTCLGAVAIIQDLTQKRELDERQIQVERESHWNELASSVAHYLRQPLTAISTFAQLLPEKYKDADFRAMYKEVVTGEVDRLSGMIGQIEDYSRRSKLDYRALDLSQLLQNCLDAMLKHTNGHSVHIETAFDEGLPPVWGDATYLEKCFTYVMENALEGACKVKNPKVMVTAQHGASARGADQVTITIEDNGPGIPARDQDKAFTPFSSKRADDIGLALPIAQRIVIDHEGQIDLESDGRKGKRILIGLPTAESGAKP